MTNKGKILWITRTAALVALLIVLQAATSPLGNQLITGSIVNLILVVAVMVCGISSGLTVAVISPVMAKLFGIGPLWSIIPFIMAGNVVLIVLWHIIGNDALWTGRGGKSITYAAALIIAAFAKFIVLYAGIVKLAVPLLLNLPEKQAAAISAMFAVPQFITAFAGGAVAVAVFPTLKMVIAKND
jgi:hypothetical protein